MPDVHAKLSPSSSSRWLTCTKSVSLESAFEDTSSSFAAEGTLAHSLGENMILFALDRITAKQYANRLKKIKNSQYYSDEMTDYCVAYRDFVLASYEDAKALCADAVINIEQRLDLSEYAPECFGTGDAVIVTEGYVQIIDLKYGKGVKVSPVKNPQLQLYGLGAYCANNYLFDIDRVVMSIFQPRVHNNHTYEASLAELEEWGHNFVTPRAKMALNGEGELCAGDHCKFCKAGAVCRARADYNLDLARLDFADPDTLDDDELKEVLTKARELVTWTKRVEEYALDHMRSGYKVPGYKVVAGRGKRVINRPDALEEAFISKGFAHSDIYRESMKPLGELQKLAGGRKQFDALTEGMVESVPGKPTIADETDDRAEWFGAEDLLGEII